MTEDDKFLIRWTKESTDVKVVSTELQLPDLWNSVMQEMTVLHPGDLVVTQYCEYIYKLYAKVFEGTKPPSEELLVRLEQLEDLIWALDLENHGGS